MTNWPFKSIYYTSLFTVDGDMRVYLYIDNTQAPRVSSVGQN